jgi:sec-independent protein translocase protein TatB/colicin import membrane protein
VFGIGGFELFLILLFAFLIFGPDKLPAMAKTLGRAIAKFREAQEGMSEQLKSASFIDKDSDNPFKNPLDVVEGAAAQAKTTAKKVGEGGDAAVGAAKKAASVNSSATAGGGHSSGFAERKAAYDAQRAVKKAQEAAQVQQSASQKSAAASDPKADVAPKSAVDAVATGGKTKPAATTTKSANTVATPSTTKSSADGGAE